MRHRPRGHRRQGQDGRIDPYLMILALELLQRIQRMERKPPITLSLMAFMSVLFVYKGQPGIPTSQMYALCPNQVVEKGEFLRLIVSAFLHGDQWHLYHNMASFLWKGANLELRLGSEKFSQMLIVLLMASHVLFLVVSIGLLGTTLQPQPYYQCAVGFSAVLFALKVVLNTDSPAYSNVYGLQVPTKYAAWLELVVIHFLVPNASFLGHLCGILAGYIYVRYRDYVHAIRVPRMPQQREEPRGPRYTYAKGQGANSTVTSSSTRPNTDDSSPEPSQTESLKMDELRRRRLNRFH